MPYEGSRGSQYSDTDVRCPVFRAANDKKRTMICEGAIPGTRIRFSLRAESRYAKFRRDYCEGDYERCPYYRAVEERY